jgi:CheY-like chemotaxis protein
VLYLPECVDSASAVLPEPAAVPIGAGQSLLVVDDDPVLLEMLAEMLRRLGFAPVCFGDARQALEALDKEPRRYAALITDEVMPGLTGTELVERLRVDHPDLPVLLVSGFGGALLAARAAASGVNRVLAKPVRRAELAHALAELLG